MEINLTKIREKLSGWGWWVALLALLWFAYNALSDLHVAEELAKKTGEQVSLTALDRIVAWLANSWIATIMALFAPPLTVAVIRNSPLARYMMPGAQVMTAVRKMIMAKLAEGKVLSPEDALVLQGIAVRNGLWLLAYMVFAHGLLGRL